MKYLARLWTRKKYVKFNQDGIKGVDKINEIDETISNTFFKLDWFIFMDIQNWFIKLISEQYLFSHKLRTN